MTKQLANLFTNKNKCAAQAACRPWPAKLFSTRPLDGYLQGRVVVGEDGFVRSEQYGSENERALHREIAPKNLKSLPGCFMKTLHSSTSILVGQTFFKTK